MDGMNGVLELQKLELDEEVNAPTQEEDSADWPRSGLSLLAC